jgi:uncharacterized delta-60 repeat protein
VTTPIANGDAFADALALQSDGKLIAAGGAYNGSNNDFALVRYNSDGRLDGSFGKGGEVTMDFAGTYDAITGLTLQSDGKVVAVGTNYGLDRTSVVKSCFALARYLTTDTSACVGDCESAGVVSVSDLVTGVNIVLGIVPKSACPAFEGAQGIVEIEELVSGVANALNGCPTIGGITQQ